MAPSVVGGVVEPELLLPYDKRSKDDNKKDTKEAKVAKETKDDKKNKS